MVSASLQRSALLVGTLGAGFATGCGTPRSIEQIPDSARQGVLVQRDQNASMLAPVFADVAASEAPIPDAYWTLNSDGAFHNLTAPTGHDATLWAHCNDGMRLVTGDVVTYMPLGGSSSQRLSDCSSLVAQDHLTGWLSSIDVDTCSLIAPEVSTIAGAMEAYLAACGSDKRGVDIDSYALGVAMTDLDALEEVPAETLMKSFAIIAWELSVRAWYFPPVVIALSLLEKIVMFLIGKRMGASKLPDDSALALSQKLLSKKDKVRRKALEGLDEFMVSGLQAADIAGTRFNRLDLQHLVKHLLAYVAMSSPFAIRRRKVLVTAMKAIDTALKNRPELVAELSAEILSATSMRTLPFVNSAEVRIFARDLRRKAKEAAKSSP